MADNEESNLFQRAPQTAPFDNALATTRCHLLCPDEERLKLSSREVTEAPNKR